MNSQPTVREQIDALLKREQEYVQQCTLANIEAARTTGQWIIHDPNRIASTDKLLALFEAMALEVIGSDQDTFHSGFSSDPVVAFSKERNYLRLEQRQKLAELLQKEVN